MTAITTRGAVAETPSELIYLWDPIIVAESPRRRICASIRIHRPKPTTLPMHVGMTLAKTTQRGIPAPGAIVLHVADVDRLRRIINLLKVATEQAQQTADAHLVFSDDFGNQFPWAPPVGESPSEGREPPDGAAPDWRESQESEVPHE